MFIYLAKKIFLVFLYQPMCFLYTDDVYPSLTILCLYTILSLKVFNRSSKDLCMTIQFSIVKLSIVLAAQKLCVRIQGNIY